MKEKPFGIIDILPKQVPGNSAGQYFAVEDFFLRNQIGEIKKKHLNVILKLNCYMDITIDDEKNPAPDKIRDMMLERSVNISIGETVILSEPDDTYLTIYEPDEELLKLVKEIASSEGLFVWGF